MKPSGLDPSDIEAVRSALIQVSDSDDLLGLDDITGTGDHVDELRTSSREVRRALVDELVGFLEAREDLIDLQVRNGVDPIEHLLLGPDPL
jgi:hypothetical protein